MQRENEQVFDYDLFGDFNELGELGLYGEEALRNSLRLWIASHRGERLNEPSRGGYLIQYLTKPMSQVNRMQMEQAMLSGLKEDFEPALKVTNLSITPNYEGRYWLIQLQATVPELRLVTAFEERVRAMA